ncbi:MAG: DUF2339 domain-containing protein, partial [Rickettsiales bacterium]|nr:DUF2339 domain-containing protein [Rickettsiales bacterium]
MEWSLFCFLALASVALAYFDKKLYGFVPWIALAVNCVMLMLWDYDRTLMFMTILSLLSIIYIAPSYYCITKRRSPLHWAGILSAAALAFYMIAYYKITDAQTPLPFGFVWGTFALIATFAMVHLVFVIHEMDIPTALREKLYAVFCVAATSFLSIGLFIECAREFLSLAFAAQILAISWINSKVTVKALRPICMVLSVIFALLLTPQILLMLQLTIYSLFEARIYVQSEVPIVSYPIVQLGLPALMMVTASYYLRKQHDGTFVYWLESAFIIMIATTGYYFMRNIMHPDQNVLFIKADFIERGILTNKLLVYAFLCLWSGRIFKRHIFSWGGVILTFAGAFRILYFDLFLYNPLFEYTNIKGPVIANSLFITYALPALWLYYIQKELQQVRFISFFSTGIGLIYLAAFAGIILFTWLNLNIRYMFHEHSLTLQHNTTTNMEIYTYSAAWLVVGIGVLFAGLLRQSKVLR